MERGPSPFSTREAVRYGWTETKRHLRPLVFIGAVSLLFSLVQRAASGPYYYSYSSSSYAYRGSALGSLLSLVLSVAQIAVALVYVRAALLIHDHGELDLKRPAALLSRFLPFLLVSILYGLVVTLGFFLLIVPGVIWGLKFAFAPYLVIDRELDPLEAMRVSSRLTAGEKRPLFVLALALCGLNLLGALAFGIGLVLTMPVTYLAGAFVLRRLQAHAIERVPLPPTDQLPQPTTP